MVLDSLIEYSHFINQNQHIVFLMDQPRPLFVCFRPFLKQKIVDLSGVRTQIVRCFHLTTNTAVIGQFYALDRVFAENIYLLCR